MEQFPTYVEPDFAQFTPMSPVPSFRPYRSATWPPCVVDIDASSGLHHRRCSKRQTKR